MHGNNKLIIAVAGSGKTTFLINEALKKKDGHILITTYTIANCEEIRKKIIKKSGYIPQNIEIQTWFSLLIQHGVKPFQSHFDKGLSDFKIKGLLLTNTKSAVKYTNSKGIPVCYEESEIKKHFFTPNNRIYSDKLAKFVVGGGDRFRKTKERKFFVDLMINRLSKIYSDIYIDEVQDLAGYDLIFLQYLFKSSINVLMVCDPRQVTYLTHHETKFKQYKDGKIKEFIKTDNKKYFKDEDIDETSLRVSHRNNNAICKLSSKLFPEYVYSEPCTCFECRKSDSEDHIGVFIVKKCDVKKYLSTYNPMQLRDKKTVLVNEKFDVANFGESKGLTFNRVLIYPTKEFIKWLKDDKYKLAPTSRSKFYVAITRAIYSVGIICDEKIEIADVNEFINTLPN
ncbi:MAG: ATP-dependent helicase [Candidatus Shapirobacteria bacterium]|jgi:DNA helicase-2/ATP-dependent DNA helicase PcrA